MKKFLLISMLVFLGCEHAGTEALSYTDVSGIYDVTSLTQHILDNEGRDETTEISSTDGWLLGISQSGATVHFFGCYGTKNPNGNVYCDASGEEYTEFGPMHKRVTGSMNFSLGRISAALYVEVYYEYLGYWGANELRVEAFYNKELTESLRESFEEYKSETISETE